MMFAMTVAPETVVLVAIIMCKLTLMTIKTALTVTAMSTACFLVSDMALEIYFKHTGVPG